MSWIFKRAEERAKQYSIVGVTYHLTQQVVKNIIPAIASTNALISAACVNEALKWRSWCSLRLNTYLMYMGGEQTGTASDTFVYKRNENCPKCHAPLLVTAAKTDTVAQLSAKIEKDGKLGPSTLMFRGPIPLKMASDDNSSSRLQRTLEEVGVIHNSQLLAIERQGRNLKVIVTFADGWEE